ncbi:hypothetical protein HRD49_19610 [Corallococcus exiguus]|uniref:hypothetical protein n=1 Tax=Corallococcus TaxID=83461 RepID=UPI000EA3FF0C|nr:MULTISPECIES: hypothetical protein [Corallococcus]NNC17600.1 hypothetical protein [Corallococcus exiguus]NRD53997.1 hypothetical protein [Corallococcus exiguus]NRD63963.1 hypothetical protein [Corallococcus exiguus]RKH24511.1 hypothetical protein D7V77_20515 [Corallococcus sp. CA041A]RKI07712.1 hypothetical protein D7Y15_27605 [Corallococcus sp. AB030]
MKTLSMTSLLSGLALFAAPAAFASSTTSIPAFEASISTAQGPLSPGGATILRSELRTAMEAFIYDTGGPQGVDSAERAYLTTRLNDTPFQQSLTGTAAKYYADFYELNDATFTSYPLYQGSVAGTAASLFGATGPLASNADIREGYIPNGQGIANQATLGTAFTTYFEPPVGPFQPITVKELIERLGTTSIKGSTPSVDEVEGAVAYITQISRNSNRLYVADWTCRRCSFSPWNTRGYVIAAVSTDRRFVRMVSVWTADFGND